MSIQRWAGLLVAMAVVAVLAPSAADAGKGDVKSAGKMLYIWHLDEGKGKEVAEASGRGPTGTFVGDVKWTDGVAGKAIALAGKPGDAQYVEFAGDDQLDITEGLTLAAWIRIDEIPAGGGESKATIFYKNTYYLQVEPNTGALAYYFYDTNNPGYHLSTNTVTPKEWTHAAVTWDGGKVRFYLNGKRDPNVIDQKGPGRSTPGKAVFVGGENNGCCPRFFDGSIDELAVANYALSDDELNTLIKGALSVEPQGKLATRWASLKAR